MRHSGGGGIIASASAAKVATSSAARPVYRMMDSASMYLRIQEPVVSAPAYFSQALRAHSIGHHSTLQNLPKPLLAAPAFPNPFRGGVLDTVASFASAAYFPRFRLPNFVMIVPRPNYGVGDLMQNRVLDV